MVCLDFFYWFYKKKWLSKMFGEMFLHGLLPILVTRTIEDYGIP